MLLRPAAQLRHHVQLRVPRAPERWVVALALRVVLPQVDVHRARPLEAGHPEDMRQSNHRSHTCSRATSLTRKQASVPITVSSRARWATSELGRHASNQRTVAFRMGSLSATGRPRIEPSILDHDEN
jgi:hypothetical protein